MMVRRLPPRFTSGDITDEDGTAGGLSASGPDIVYIGHNGKILDDPAPEGFHVGGIDVKSHWGISI